MTFSLALQEQYRAEYWQKQDKKLHGTVFSNKYHPLLISVLLQTAAVDDRQQDNHQGFPI